MVTHMRGEKEKTSINPCFRNISTNSYVLLFVSRRRLEEQDDGERKERGREEEGRKQEGHTPSKIRVRNMKKNRLKFSEESGVRTPHK